MAQDWRVQLQSDDPKVRAQAVKTLALSGNPDNLTYLKDIVENDPDPRVRDYAKKAARHLYTTTGSPEPGESTPAPAPSPKPEYSSPAPDRQGITLRSEPEVKPPDDESQEEDLSKKISQTERTAAESKIQRALAMHMKGQTQKGLKSLVQGIDLNPNLVYETFTMSVASELTGMAPDLAIKALQDPEQRRELLNQGKGKTRKPPRKADPETPAEPGEQPKRGGSAPGLVQSWLSYFSMTEDFFARVVGGANLEDTLISVLVYMIASIIAFMISSVSQLQMVMPILQQELGTQIPDLGPFMLTILVAMIIFVPISFFFGAGIQYLGLRIFGGSGTFKEHIYVMGLITVPMTVLSLAITLPTLIPNLSCITGIIGLGLSIWSLVVLVRGMNVVHDLPTGRTIAGLILPPIILGAAMFCILTLTGSLIGRIFEGIISSQGGFPQ